MVSGKWKGSTRRESLPPRWRYVIRPRILRRDCYVCTEPGCCELATDVDHVISHELGGSDEDENLTSLCRPHHAKKSAQEGLDARRAKQKAALRTPEQTPGPMRQDHRGGPSR